MGSDAYGATRFQDGCWLHGVPMPWAFIDPFCITYGNGAKVKYYVPNKKTETYLKKHGYKAEAVGAPITYTHTKTDRLQGSILFMPSHGMTGTVTNWAGYFRSILPVARQYTNAAICVHQNDYWEAVKHNDTGLLIIEGAGYNDRNSLERMAYLFQKFETICVNGEGSHIYYALAFDCYVKYKPFPTGITLDYLQQTDAVWSKRPELATRYWYLRERMGAQWLKSFAIPRKDVTLGKKMIYP